MHAVQVLIEALQEYEGTFVAVSHDRHFITNIANKVWYIEDHQVKEYPGTYAEYENWNSKREISGASKAVVKKPAKEKKAKPKGGNDQKVLKKLENKASMFEREIDKLEKEKEEIGMEMAEPEVFSNPDKLAEYTERLKSISNNIDDKTKAWEDVMLEMENA